MQAIYHLLPRTRSEVNSGYGFRASQKEKGKPLCHVAAKGTKYAEESIEQCHEGGKGAFTVLEHILLKLAAGMGQIKEMLAELQ